MVLGQPPNENMVGRWGTWRRGACVDDRFDPEHRGYGYRLYDSVLHELPLFVETGTWSDACYHYINLPVLFGRVLQVTACSYTDPLFGFESEVGIWGQVHVADAACGACRTRNPACMGDDGGPPGDELVNGRMAREVDLVALDAVGCASPTSNASNASNASEAGGEDDGGGEGDSSSPATACTMLNSSRFLDTPRSRRARAELRLGWPMAGQEGCAFKECQYEQEAEVQAWAESVLRPALHRLRQKHGQYVKLYWELDLLHDAAMRDVLSSDIALSCLPLPLGFLYLLLYTGSVFLALAGALQLGIAWPTAFFLYRYW